MNLSDSHQLLVTFYPLVRPQADWREVHGVVQHGEILIERPQSP